MHHKFNLAVLATALAFGSVPAFAEVTAEQVTQSLEGQGYTSIEVAAPANGQIVARGTNADGVAVDVVYDSETGQVVSAEAADAAASSGAATGAAATDDGSAMTGSDTGAASSDTGAASSDMGATGSDAGAANAEDAANTATSG
ncbi:PepSY domain-containing protein [Paracoccus aurantiacus]|uniref:PepSY domain-containing protein n=1 Tax=Paracoccus aurantiacus TaxID=2599412 RepID=A0A5C6S463_9RHOB|nr:PepSY domain-containing protein [Paracoccus aurantiacus]TXB69239.1 PepSY domain-containing protein [Paracoccus aurantiacus]